MKFEKHNTVPAMDASLDEDPTQAFTSLHHAATLDIEPCPLSCSSILGPARASERLYSSRKELCELLRQLLFGSIGNEHKIGRRRREEVLYERCGTREQVAMLYSLWDRLDLENTGLVPLADFKQLMERMVVESNKRQEERQRSADGKPPLSSPYIPLWFLGPLTAEDRSRFAARLCGKVQQMLNRNALVIEDLMRLLWPCAQLHDLETMKLWCVEAAQCSPKWRVFTPRPMAREDLESLTAVFKSYDADGSGEVSLEELIRGGLLDSETADAFIRAADADGSGELSLQEFWDLFCPSGARPTEASTLAFDADGTRIAYDARIGGWRVEAPHVGLLEPGSGLLAAMGASGAH